MMMGGFPKHLFAEPDPDPETLAHLGPLARMAGLWEGEKGHDIKPTEDGAASQAYVETIELVPIDPQMNGPQLLYGLRYHTHITKPGEVEMYHDQVGYWLWEPATGHVFHSLTIPRGQVALATGKAKPRADTFSVKAKQDAIVSAPFLEENFRTKSFKMVVTIHDDDSWSYDQTIKLKIKGVKKVFDHRDRNTLRRIGPAHRNPLAQAE
jgi:hypothetical protein